MFHRVMTIVYKPGTILQIWDLRTSHSTYPEIQASWLVEKWQQILISDTGWLGRVILKSLSSHFKIYCCKFQFQYVNQCQNHSSENWNKCRILKFWVLRLIIPENQYFLYGQTPSSPKSAKEIYMKVYCHYSVKQWLTLVLNPSLSNAPALRIWFMKF